LHELQDSSVVGSICVKEADETTAPDFGYHPFVDALLNRMRGVLAP
jgi:hypothetical protein